MLNPYGAGIDFRRQILPSKVDPRTEKETIYNGRTAMTCIQMKRKKLTKTVTFMMIPNWKKPSGLHGLYKIYHRYKG